MCSPEDKATENTNTGGQSSTEAGKITRDLMGFDDGAFAGQKTSNVYDNALPASANTAPLKVSKHAQQDEIEPSTAAKRVITTPRSHKTTATDKSHSWVKDPETGEDELAFRVADLPKNAGDKQWNVPGGRGDWEFAPGTDLTVAVLNEAAPGKFVLFRQRPDDENNKELRIFPGFAEFDWSSAEDVAALNKYRDQIISRTTGIGKVGAPWTQLERDILEGIIKEAFSSGVANGVTINWEKVKSNLTKHFDGVTQEQGVPLAQSTKLLDDVETGHFVHPRKLKETRTGIPERSAKNIENATKSFASILKLIRDNYPPGAKIRRTDPRFERIKYTEAYLAKQARKRKALEDGEDWESEPEPVAPKTKPKAKRSKKRKVLHESEEDREEADDGDQEDSRKTKLAKSSRLSISENMEKPKDSPTSGSKDSKDPPASPFSA